MSESSVTTHPPDTQPIRGVGDTAYWVATYRAEESRRADALFSDPWAERLAGRRGAEIRRAMPRKADQAWPFVVRTYLFDTMIAAAVAGGVDTVVNLGAGLDTRPYRMSWPGDLRWFEIDLPEALTYKRRQLGEAQPRCRLEQVGVDLARPGARREVFEAIASGAERALIVSEGLLVYFEAAQVARLASDLAERAAFGEWILDLASPGLLEMVNRQLGEALRSARLRFAPAEGPAFFRPCGWELAEARSILHTAARHRRVSLFLRLVALLPESSRPRGSKPWSAVCRLTAGRGR